MAEQRLQFEKEKEVFVSVGNTQDEIKAKNEILLQESQIKVKQEQDQLKRKYAAKESELNQRIHLLEREVKTLRELVSTDNKMDGSGETSHFFSKDESVNLSIQ